MSKFGFLARKSSPAEKPDEPAANKRQPARTRRGIVLRARRPARRRERGAAQLAARRQQQDQRARHHQGRGRQAGRSGQQGAARNSKPKRPRRSACRPCSTTRAPPTASCAMRSATSRRNWRLRARMQALRQDLAATQSLLHTLETTKTDFAIDMAARRAQIADLEVQLAQRTGEMHRVARGKPPARRTAGRRRQARDRARIRPDRRAPAPADGRGRKARAAGAARQSRRRGRAAVAQADRNRSELQRRAQAACATSKRNFNELSIERTRLATTLDEANERHEHERADQRTRFDSLAGARDDERKAAGRCARAPARPRRRNPRLRPAHDGDIALRARCHAGAASPTCEADRIQSESKYKELDQANATAISTAPRALARALTAKEAALERAEGYRWPRSTNASPRWKPALGHRKADRRAR